MFAEAADDLMQDQTLFPPSQLITAPRDVFDVMRAQVTICFTHAQICLPIDTSLPRISEHLNGALEGCALQHLTLNLRQPKKVEWLCLW